VNVCLGGAYTWFSDKHAGLYYTIINPELSLAHTCHETSAHTKLGAHNKFSFQTCFYTYFKHIVPYTVDSW